MDIDKVKELVQLMIDNDLSSVSLRDGAEEITLNRPLTNNLGPAVGLPPTNGPAVVLSSASPAEDPGAANPGDEDAGAEDALVPIRSPMVGTMYVAPNPEAPPFVEIGSSVSASTVVCIIEAMKVFNEIRAEVSGTIEKILATNQQAVEYGQPLFLVRPD